tara:strand:+ start:229 stop:378 length:150 start_codon:yes stop_codon:yes gene_type:complete
MIKAGMIKMVLPYCSCLYADFAGAKIFSRPNSAVGILVMGPDRLVFKLP